MKKLFKFILIIIMIIAIVVLVAAAVAAAAGATAVGGGAAAGALSAGAGLGGAAATATSVLTGLGIATSAALSTVALYAAGVLVAALVVYDLAYRDSKGFKAVGNAVVKVAKRAAAVVRKQTRAARSWFAAKWWRLVAAGVLAYAAFVYLFNKKGQSHVQRQIRPNARR